MSSFNVFIFPKRSLDHYYIFSCNKRETTKTILISANEFRLLLQPSVLRSLDCCGLGSQFSAPYRWAHLIMQNKDENSFFVSSFVLRVWDDASREYARIGRIPAAVASSCSFIVLLWLEVLVAPKCKCRRSCFYLPVRFISWYLTRRWLGLLACELRSSCWKPSVQFVSLWRSRELRKQEAWFSEFASIWKAPVYSMPL